MKIVIIKSSPHKNGSSNMLAEQFIKGAQEAQNGDRPFLQLHHETFR